MTDAFERLSTALADRYRLVRELGAGGMATVYLAEELKHDRMVAVKVLKPELAVAIGAERFLAEIKTTANLQHPHILALHDSGEVNGTVYYVMPYVDGEPLRDRLDREKQLPIEDALRIAGEVADALQYAHERGVIHRDIKPENILLQRGHAVVADFGIALAASKSGGSRMTETGMSLGTPTYMSPEQAMGSREVDARTDVYSLGCVLYEMLLGEPPFVGPTAQSIVAKVITESPKGLTAQRHTIPAHVDVAVHTALEKLAADRFPNAAAFATALRSGGTGTSFAGARNSGMVLLVPSRKRTVLRWAAPIAAVAAAAVAAFLAGRQSATAAGTDGMSMQQRTYRTQQIFSARYSANAESYVYSAAESGTSPRVYLVSSAYPEPRAISDSATRLLSVSSKDELAVLVQAKYEHHHLFIGILARMPLGGGSPRELATNVSDADWSPDGAQLAVVHRVGGVDRLEFPIGTALYETPGYLSDIRIAPDGRHIAFLEHPEKGDNRGFVAMVEIGGKHIALTDAYSSIEGLAWKPGGGGLVFSASKAGEIGQLLEVTTRGGLHETAPGVGEATIQDIARDGRRLILREDGRSRILVQRVQASTATDLSWLNLTFFPALSRDASILIFGDGSNVAGANYATMLRRTDGSPAVRLGDGAPVDFSRDTQWVLSTIPSAPVQLMLYPTGAGSARRLDHGEFAGITTAAFAGDKSFVVCGNEQKSAVSRCYTGQLSDGALRPFMLGGNRNLVVSPDGSFVIAQVADSGYRRISISDGRSQTVPGLTAGDQVLRFSPDEKSVWLRQPNAIPVLVERVDLASGVRSALLPPFGFKRPGLSAIREVALADDPRNYVYIERESLGYLFELSTKR